VVAEDVFEIGQGQPVPSKCVFDFSPHEDFPESYGFGLGSGAANLLSFDDQVRVD